MSYEAFRVGPSLNTPLGARGSKPSAGKAERSGKRGLGGGSPRLPNHALRKRSRAQRQAGVLRSVQRSTTSAAATRSASQGVRACICFQRSAYTARSATQRAALHSAQRYTVRTLHSAQRCTAPSATQRPALHCAQRFTAHGVTQLVHRDVPRNALLCPFSIPRGKRAPAASIGDCSFGVA